ncbi:MAG: alpha/beta hydrolase [bacterium]
MYTRCGYEHRFIDEIDLSANMIRIIAVVSIIAVSILLLMSLGCSSLERKLMFHPSHQPADGGLTAWMKDGQVIGFCRKVESPQNVWLMLHGNGGQASGRGYAIPCFSTNDSVYILEYPGYGFRKGMPSRLSFNTAASEAYMTLRSIYGAVPVCEVGESIGTGPASCLATVSPPPDKVVLIVPYEKLSEVAKDRFPGILVRMILKNDWNNIDALSRYKGPVEIFGAKFDDVIPVGHAKALAAGIPSSKFVLIDCGHNEWSDDGHVKIRYEH